MSNRIILVDESKKAEINALRMQEYAKASGFYVDLSTLQWKASDDESYVMAAETDGKLVSTMRGEIISDMSMLERKLECPWDYPILLDMPVLLLSRAATLSNYRSHGLNLVLRYWFLKFAVHHGIRYVIGTFVTGSPRENTLREMGYQFFENTLGWQQSTYRSLRSVAVVVLDLKLQGEQAITYCHDRILDGEDGYIFDNQFPDLKMVRNI